MEGLFAISTLLTIIQALDYGHVLLILAAIVALVHMVTQVYVTIVALMVWLKCEGSSTSGGQGAKVGAPVILGQLTPTTVKSVQSTIEADGDLDVEAPTVDAKADVK